MKPLIAVFAKAPVPGKVKTRLAPALTLAQAALLHQRLVADVWDRLAALREMADCELHTDTPTEAWPGIEPRRLQCEGDLGARMRHALEDALAQGRPRAAIIGGDIPQIPIDAVRQLLTADADIALGPTRDGGYYAIACRRTHPGMFHGVRWSTPHALADTITACARVGLGVSIGPPWHDVDTAEDLDLLPAHLRPNTEEE